MYTRCTMTVDDLKRPRHQFSSKLSNGFFLFVISRMVKKGILNDSSIFECQIKSYIWNSLFCKQSSSLVSVTYVLNLIVSVKGGFFCW